VFFGPLGETEGQNAAELAQWWAETFEIPAVFSTPTATVAPAIDAEFVALSTSIWTAVSPRAALATIAAGLEETA
jgi:thiamine-phosphate pyrophosphorylase